jgi:two-component system response regulator HydG
VRVLENTIESLVALSNDGELDLALLPGAPATTVGTSSGGAPSGASLKQRVEAYERGLVAAALTAARGNRSEAARALGIGRATLHEKLAKYGIAANTDDAQN